MSSFLIFAIDDSRNLKEKIMKKYILTKLVSILSGAVLVGCGGGGGDTQACSTESALMVGFLYQSPLISSNGSTVVYTPGVAFSQTPTLTGVPASCNSVKRFTIAPQIGMGVNVPLPSSVTLDPVTGTIAGILQVPLGSCNGNGSGASYVNTSIPVCAAGGVFQQAFFNVTLSLPGYSGLTKAVSFYNR